MRRAHKVPLTSQVMALFEQLDEITGEGRLLFPSIRSPERAIGSRLIRAVKHTSIPVGQLAPSLRVLEREEGDHSGCHR